MNGRNGIVCGGNWIVDRVKRIDRYPPEETLANIQSESRQNGGCAFTVLVDLARLGADFPLTGIGVIGDDQDGDFIIDTCRQHQIDISGLEIRAGATTSYTDVMTDINSGRRTFFHARGANALLGPEHFDFDKATANHLHLGYLLLLDRLDELDANGMTGAATVLQRAKQAGLTTSIDLVSEASGRFQKIVTPALPFVDICFMNEYELSRTTGIQLDEYSEPDALKTATQRLFDLGLEGSAVIHSARFAYAQNASGQQQYKECPQLPASHIKSTVGAGDAFAAGYLLAIQQGRSMSESIGSAMAAATASLAGEGSSDALAPNTPIPQYPNT